MPQTLPDSTELAANIVATYQAASTGQRLDGMKWYADAHNLAVLLSQQHDGDVLRAAGVISALSPQLDWDRNKVLAIRTYNAGGITGGALGLSVRKADAIYHGADVMSTLKAPKTSAFAAVIANPEDQDAVVIDRHAMSVAHGRQVTDAEVAALGRKGFYAAYAEAYRIAARAHGISPSQMQAVTWVTWRETEIRIAASVRRAAGREAA